ncbi:MAG: hypothetical protein OER88_01585 [Planctomycetota bacterium]|nr:hypothetical protein [Planctomycetota bacterium]
MRGFLVGLIVLEAAALLALGAATAFGAWDGLARQDRAVTFQPPIYDAVMGESARYERTAKDGTVTGYLDYEVEKAVEYKGTARGREFVIVLREFDPRGRRLRSRRLAVLPRTLAHGFLPPSYEEDDDYPAGARPVIRSIKSGPVTLRRRTMPGFELEIVIPRESVTVPAERIWMAKDVAVFGVVRWERKNEVLTLHTQERFK